MLVFGDSVLRPHHLGRGSREFKRGLAFIMKITPFSPAVQEQSASGGTGFGKPTRHHSRFIHCNGVICEIVPSIVHVQLGYSSVCAWWVRRYVMEVKFMFGGALSLRQSFKGGANGFPESMVTL